MDTLIWEFSAAQCRVAFHVGLSVRYFECPVVLQISGFCAIWWNFSKLRKNKQNTYREQLMEGSKQQRGQTEPCQDGATRHHAITP